MFCDQCGKKFGLSSKFCGDCGAPRQQVEQTLRVTTPEPGSDLDSLQEQLERKAAQYVNNSGPEGAPTEYLENSSTTEFESWMGKFTEQKMPLQFQFEGFINAEVGSVWFSTKPTYSCKTCHQSVTYEFRQVDCADCGKTTSNFCSAPIGKGDGTYPVYQVQPSTGSGFIAVLATEAGEDGQGALPELLRSVLLQDFAAVVTREAVVKVPVASMLCFPEYVATSLGSISIKPEDFSNGVFNFPGLSQLIVSCPRTSEHLDGAEVRIGWEPGEFEILAITRYSAIDDVRTALDSNDGDIPYFQRPEVLAVIVVRADEVRDLFPTYKKIRSAQEVRLFERSDKWVELTRPLQGYIFAIWANWEILNDYLSSLEAGDWSPARLFQLMTSEGYLHQIWNIIQTNPDTLHHQISELGGLRPGFEELVGYCNEPGSSLTRSDLRKWFLQVEDLNN
jgi:predicted amidophosphoribosyltransferase